MILTPLQALAMVVLTALLAGIVMAIIHWYMPRSNRTLKDLRAANLWLAEQNGQLQARVQRLEHPEGIHLKDGSITVQKPATGDTDDLMDIWKALEQRHGWIEGRK